MAIRNRNGLYNKFVPSKLVPGEFAFVRSGDPDSKDGMAIYAAFDAGRTKRLATAEELRDTFDSMTGEAVENLTKEANAAAANANAAATRAENAATNVSEAIQSANTAATNATNAAASASTAATNAAKATESANTAASDASKAADDARDVIASNKSPVFKSDGFPVTGEEGRLYIDDTVMPRVIYMWDDEKGYVVTGGSDSIGTVEERDVSVEYRKDIPEYIKNTAEIGKIGGVTRKSNNLIPFPYTYGGAGAVKKMNGITWTVNADGSITANGTATERSHFTLMYSLRVASEKAYCLSGCPKGGSTSTYYIRVTGSGGSVSLLTDTGTGESNIISADTSAILLRVESGTTVSNLTFRPMINEGDTALPYEPFFEGLRSAPVTAVESVGTNLIPKFTGSSKNGVTVKVDENGVITLNGTCTGSANIYMDCPTIPKGKYCLSDSAQGTFPDSNQARTQLIFSDGSIFAISNSRDSSYALNFEINEALSYSFRIRISEGHTYSNCKLYPMINKGTEALPYKPYTQNTLSIPEAVQALDGYGEGLSDTVYNYVDWEKKQFVKRVEKVVLAGTEYWEWDYYPTAITTLKSGKNADRNYRPLNSHNLNSAISNSNGTAIGLYNLDVYLPQITSLAEWKAYLAEQYASGTPITIVYALAIPVITDISDLLADNSIQVETGGTLTFVNEHEYAVPNEVLFFKNNLVGILTGTAERAIFDEYGNKINIGKTDISSFGDGTLTGAIAALATMLTQTLPASMSMYSMERSVAEPDEIETTNIEPENIEPETLEL